MSQASIAGDTTTYGHTVIAIDPKLSVDGFPVTLAGNVDSATGIVLPNPVHKLTVGGVPVACVGDPLSHGDVILGPGTPKLIMP